MANKRFVWILMTLLVVLFISACSNETNKTNENKESEPKAEKLSQAEVPKQHQEAADKEFAPYLLDAVKNYLIRTTTPELDAELAEVIESNIGLIKESNQSSFLVMAENIRKGEKDNAELLYTALAKDYEDLVSNSEQSEKSENKSSQYARVNYKPISLSGKGDSATETFYLQPGIAIFDSSYTGESNFIVHLLDSQGDRVKSVANAIGTYNGKTVMLIDAQEKFMFNVQSDGSWKINIDQNVPSEIKSAPSKFSGTGDDVLFVNLESKLTKFSFTHSGESNFKVRLNDQRSLANEIGQYSGSIAHKISDTGTYVLSVESEGTWSIDIE